METKILMRIPTAVKAVKFELGMEDGHDPHAPVVFKKAWYDYHKSLGKDHFAQYINFYASQMYHGADPDSEEFKEKNFKHFAVPYITSGIRGKYWLFPWDYIVEPFTGCKYPIDEKSLAKVYRDVTYRQFLPIEDMRDPENPKIYKSDDPVMECPLDCGVGPVGMDSIKDENGVIQCFVHCYFCGVKGKSSTDPNEAIRFWNNLEIDLSSLK